MGIRFIAVLPLCAALLSGQQTFRVDARLVVCYTSVLDRRQHPMLDLGKESFSVYENDVRQTIQTFSHEDMPVSLGLVIDNSANMADKRAKVVAASVALVRDSNPTDEVFVVNFNEEAFLDLPNKKDFTSDIHEMEAALGRIDARGEALVRDAVRISIDHLQRKAHHDKKVLVVVTSGYDTFSRISREELADVARQSGVVIYVVGLLDVSVCRNPRAARHMLRELADVTGGEAFFPKHESEVEGIAHQIARDIRDQYVIAYTPSNKSLDGAFRRIRVAVDASRHAQARTRDGYYASQDQRDSAPKAASR